MDVLTREQRHKNMSNIRAHNTGPEKKIRALLRDMKCEFATNAAHLTGKPDFVLEKSHGIIFVHGCFWHMHSCPSGKVAPKTNAKFWNDKRSGTKKRDTRINRALKRAGWKILTVWECQLREDRALLSRLKQFTSDK